MSAVLLVVSVLLLATLCSGKLLNPLDFEREVVGSKEVWLVEFFSSRCGSCQEFAPVWEKLQRRLGDAVRCGEVSIDEREGLRLAEALGVLEEGLPSVRLFARRHGSDAQGLSVASEDTNFQLSAIVNNVKEAVSGLDKDTTGYYLKN